MSIDQVEIKIYHVEYLTRKGLFTEEIIPRPVYIIKRSDNNTLIYTNIPEGVVLHYKRHTQTKKHLSTEQAAFGSHYAFLKREAHVHATISAI